MAGDYRVQFVLKLAKDTWRIDARKIPVHVLVDNFDERQKLRQ